MKSITLGTIVVLTILSSWVLSELVTQTLEIAGNGKIVRVAGNEITDRGTQLLTTSELVRMVDDPATWEPAESLFFVRGSLSKRGDWLFFTVNHKAHTDAGIKNLRTDFVGIIEKDLTTQVSKIVWGLDNEHFALQIDGNNSQQIIVVYPEELITYWLFDGDGGRLYNPRWLDNQTLAFQSEHSQRPRKFSVLYGVAY